MSGPDRKPSQDSVSSPDPSPGSNPSPESIRERIALELEALGEDPLDDSPQGDLAVEFALGDGHPHADIDVATVQTLAGWAEPVPGQVDELSELAQARVWRTIELRGKADKPRAKADEDSDEDADSSTVRSTRPVLFAVVALLAVAAAVVLVPVLTADTPELSEQSPVAQAPAASSITAEELDVLSTQARAGLAALDRLSGEPTGTARVEAMASDYAGRLEALGNAPGQGGPQGNQG